ncbi:MAG: putative CpaC [Alphaproteobacteria bacterium]|jgi:pilus assembly protein CpaC|nr:putative CpaC [Alphaproteobacteria bacterium]
MMRPLYKIALAAAGVCLVGLGFAVVNIPAPAVQQTRAIWIGPAPDTDRAVNALPEEAAPRSADPAKAQMASPATGVPSSISANAAADVAKPEFPLPPPIKPAKPADASKLAQPESGNVGKPVEKASAIVIEEAQPRFDLAQLIVPPVLPNKIVPPAPILPRVQANPPASTAQATPVAPAPGAAVGINAAVTPAAAASVVTGTSGRDVVIEINRGALVKLQAPADTVFIANPDIADIQVKSPRLLYLYGKRAGETVLYAVDGDDNVLLNTRVKVTHNLAAFRSAIRSAAPSAGVDVATVGDALVISGDVGSAVQAENVRRLAARFAPGDGAVVNQMRVTAPNQINLRVRIAEVSRETLKELGINWAAVFQTGGFAFGLVTGQPLLSVGQLLAGTSNTNKFLGSYSNKSLDINGLIDALANDNLISVLAEPNLTAMSGETANFLAGGEFPIPVAQSGANAGAITVEFKKFGVGLAFTPTVLENGRVNLKVRPEVSQLSSVGGVQVSGITVPALTTRRAETTVELSSGQSFAIAGLLQNNSTQDASKVPFLGDVPVLGALFKSDRYRRNETELVIVVTPYLVNPVSANTIALPTDGLVPPTDGQRILYGSTNRQDMPQGAPVARGRDGNALVGPAGFQLD